MMKEYPLLKGPDAIKSLYAQPASVTHFVEPVS